MDIGSVSSNDVVVLPVCRKPVSSAMSALKIAVVSAGAGLFFVPAVQKIPTMFRFNSFTSASK